MRPIYIDYGSKTSGLKSEGGLNSDCSLNFERSSYQNFTVTVYARLCTTQERILLIQNDIDVEFRFKVIYIIVSIQFPSLIKFCHQTR